jgi:sn-2 palmitoyl-lipid 9-desaturase
VGNHRRHHAHTEDPVKDPHSAQRGFWWSHMGWILAPEKESFNEAHYEKFAPDLRQQPFYRYLNQFFLLLQVPLALVLYAWGGWSFVIYGIFVRAVLLWHTTWFVNSATHQWGYQTFASRDSSRNLWWVSLLTYGEGWHNNHHAHPSAAQAGYRWWELDPTWWMIQVLQKVGLATKVRKILVAKE